MRCIFYRNKLNRRSEAGSIGAAFLCCSWASLQSLLSAAFSDQQNSALADYLQASVMLQSDNRRWCWLVYTILTHVYSSNCWYWKNSELSRQVDLLRGLPVILSTLEFAIVWVSLNQESTIFFWSSQYIQVWSLSRCWGILQTVQRCEQLIWTAEGQDKLP